MYLCIHACVQCSYAVILLHVHCTCTIQVHVFVYTDDNTLHTGISSDTCTLYIHVHVGLSPTRGSSFFRGKVTALCVLRCFALFVCLTLLASFFLPSLHSLKHVYNYI